MIYSSFDAPVNYLSIKM